MTAIGIGPDLIRTDAGIVARALKPAPRELQATMREGTVTAGSRGVKAGMPGNVPASGAADRDRLDAMLDAALDQTFPASDPIALDFGNRD
jgi:hypothetical protein